MARVFLSFLLGALLGFEREWARRPAGLRTHMLVAGGSTCFTLASAYGFSATAGQVDPSRIAAQVVTGVGFLGAGTIFRTASTVRGLTTAASIWIVAAIGLLVGVGLYGLAVFTTALAFVALHLLRGVRPPTEAGDE
ncbi:MAG: MgtC/SapB family protein [Chloroflexi bacterium]|nr:MgtC/SapB family protein [Chloroflexota bacterium]